VEGYSDTYKGFFPVFVWCVSVVKVKTLTKYVSVNDYFNKNAVNCFDVQNSRVCVCVLPISVAARSKAWVYGRSLAGIVDSNPAGGMDVFVECCVLSGRGADNSSREILLTVMHRCV